MKLSPNKKVLVAMSSGVDSSVAAYLFKKQGYQVIGVFLHFWSIFEKQKTFNRCCSPESEKIAKEVARKLNIPFYYF